MFDWYAPPSLSAAVCLRGLRTCAAASSLGLHSTAARPDGHRKVARISTHCQPVALPRERIVRTTMPVTQEQVHSALKEVLDPNTGTDFLSTKSARNIKVEGGSVSLEIELGYPAKTQLDPIRKLVGGKLRGVPGVSAVNVSVTSKIVSHSVQRGVKLIPGGEEHRRGGVGQRRSGKIHNGGQPGPRSGRR